MSGVDDLWLTYEGTYIPMEAKEKYVQCNNDYYKLREAIASFETLNEFLSQCDNIPEIINRGDRDKNTVLYDAAIKGLSNKDVIMLLLKHGASLCVDGKKNMAQYIVRCQDEYFYNIAHHVVSFYEEELLTTTSSTKMESSPSQ